MADQVSRATLTIRIDPALHRSLAAVADAEGLSMNALAEVALTREVTQRAAELADAYERAAQALREHAAPRLGDLVGEIAAGEAAGAEPVPTKHEPDLPAATFQAISNRAHRMG
jgi:hypothetical protein